MLDAEAGEILRAAEGRGKKHRRWTYRFVVWHVFIWLGMAWVELVE